MDQPPPSERLEALHQTLTNAHLPSAAPDVEAAVGVILLESDGKLEVLLVRRVEKAGDPWSGHISFPGGRIKAMDRSSVEACEREVVEEVGIDLERNGMLLGGLSPAFPSNRPELKVQPWVFGLSLRPEIVVGPEVVTAFWVPLSSLPNLRGQSKVLTRVGERLVDSFVVDGRIVWGFTYRVLVELLRIASTVSG